jgi:hypothetical protein
VIWRIISSWIESPHSCPYIGNNFCGLEGSFDERLLRSVLDVVAESPFVPLEKHARKGVLALKSLLKQWKLLLREPGTS